ncbi:MAG: hypothetical protein ACT4O1_18185 [Gemmatimonadota bacterium]
MKRWLFLLPLVVLAACSDDSTDPDERGVEEEELNILRFVSANAVAVKQASFWAVKGQDRKLDMVYADGEDFLEFEVDAQSLLRRPNGTLFQNGDSVLITVTLDARNLFIVYFEPSGLVFNPARPAELEINYRLADDDIDGDGDEDEKDTALELALRIWRQERPGLPWLPLATLRVDDDELEARVLSFTGFAMASN